MRAACIRLTCGGKLREEEGLLMLQQEQVQVQQHLGASLFTEFAISADRDGGMESSVGHLCIYVFSRGLGCRISSLAALYWLVCERSFTRSSPYNGCLIGVFSPVFHACINNLPISLMEVAILNELYQEDRVDGFPNEVSSSSLVLLWEVSSLRQYIFHGPLRLLVRCTPVVNCRISEEGTIQGGDTVRV